jgi:hypothetical protein
LNLRELPWVGVGKNYVFAGGIILTEMLINISKPKESPGVMMLSVCALLWVPSDGSAQVAQSALPVARISGDTFTNPLLQNGADPWVIWWKGSYYYSDSSSRNLTLRKTADITKGKMSD